MLQNYNAEFLTATIFSWYYLLKEDSYKHIILDSFEWLAKEKKCTINPFVILLNNIHLIWKYQVDSKEKGSGSFILFFSPSV